MEMTMQYSQASEFSCKHRGKGAGALLLKLNGGSVGAYHKVFRISDNLETFSFGFTLAGREFMTKQWRYQPQDKRFPK